MQKNKGNQQKITHKNVMQQFANQLKVDYSAVHTGFAAEQALVRYASIHQSQQGTMFRRDQQTGNTWFKLFLTSDELDSFMEHYNSHHAGAIKGHETLTEKNGVKTVKITFDTQKLYEEIIPILSA